MRTAPKLWLLLCYGFLAVATVTSPAQCAERQIGATPIASAGQLVNATALASADAQIIPSPGQSANATALVSTDAQTGTPTTASPGPLAHATALVSPPSTSPALPGIASPGASTLASPAPPITSYQLPADKLAKAEALYKSRITMFVVGNVYGLAVLLLVLFARWNARFRDIAERMSRRRFVQALIFSVLIFLTMDVLSLPVEIYRHHLALDYGLSVQGWASWAGDVLKSEAIGLIIATLVAWGLYAVLRRSPKRWWLYGWLAMIPFILLLILIEPLVIAPLFNKFEPLETRQPQLIPELEKVMHRGGLTIERSRMFEMKASEKETTYNAYVSGIGASKRVVVWDNTIRDLNTDEILFIFGHEQGHYVLNHIWIMVSSMIAALLVGLYALSRTIGEVLRRWGPRWEIRDLSDWASLPAMMLVFSLFSLVAQPIQSSCSRYFEHQADIYGLKIISGIVPDPSQAAARAFQHLGEKALSYPNPARWYVLWAYDHPTIADRIRFVVDHEHD